jgi:hypothetical protein
LLRQTCHLLPRGGELVLEHFDFLPRLRQQRGKLLIVGIQGLRPGMHFPSLISQR